MSAKDFSLLEHPSSAKSDGVFAVINRPVFSIGIIVILHTVGLFGLSSESRDWFLAMTPLNLIVSSLIVFLAHQQWSTRGVLVLSVAFITGMVAEIIGVSTGMIFGEYVYGETLGLKVLDVPLTIGLNWAILVYCTGVISQQLFTNIWAKSALGAGLMVGLDVVMEPVAIALDFWNWFGNPIPIQNYVAWFIIAFGLHFLFQKTFGKLQNPTAIGLFVAQVLFFTILNFTL